MKAIWERKCVSQINKKKLGEKMDLIETSRNILIGQKKGDK